MKSTFILIIFFVSSIIAKGQIPNELIEAANKLDFHYASNIDSTRQLSDGCFLTYSSDSTFLCFHLTLKKGIIIPLDVRLKNNHRGFVIFKSDHKGFILINERGDGSGNPTYITKVSKLDGTRKSQGKED